MEFYSHKKIRENNIQCNLILNVLISRNFCKEFANIHSVRNFTATVFSQKFRQINVLPKNFTENWFDEKKLLGSQFLVLPFHSIVLLLLFFFAKITWNQLDWRHSKSFLTWE